jgi:hypothetical protein
MHAQQAWGRGLSPPWWPVLAALAEVVGRPLTATEYVLNLIAVAVAFAGAVVVVRWWRQGTMPTSATAWTVTAIVLPLCTVVISSQIRFVMAAWPAAAAFAYRGRGARVLRLCAGAVGITLSVLLVRRWANDSWVA